MTILVFHSHLVSLVVSSNFVDSCTSAPVVAVADVIDDDNSGVSLTPVSVVVSSSFVESCSSVAAVAVADVDRR